MNDEQLARAHVTRVLEETRAALGLMARETRLAHPLMSICVLIDRVNVDVTTEEGDDAFVLDEATSTITFRAGVVLRVLQETDRFADEVGYSDDDERRRLVQLAVNLLVIHELTHIKQNFPHFGSVQEVKEGLPGYGVPILDVAADIVAAWTCANVESERTGYIDRQSVMRAYVNALLLAYLVGTFVFDVRGRVNKTQRALGLIISALLVQAQADGELVRDSIYENWTEISPILVMDLSKVDTFNALVIDALPGILVSRSIAMPIGLVSRFWESVGTSPMMNTLALGGEILFRLGVIRPKQPAAAFAAGELV